MKVRINKNGFESSEIEEVKSIVVFDDFGNPMYASRQMNENNSVQGKAGEPGFEEMLKTFGLRLKVPYKTVKMQ
jgi:hypothetical protein